MEDPWGSPWAADNPSTIDLPAPPQSAHFPAENLNPRRISPAPSVSGWGDDDAWGGWNDASGGSFGGRDSPGWERSPGLKPIRTRSPSVRGTSPSPWRGVGLGGLDTSELGRPERRRTDSVSSREARVVDSAISLGEGESLHGDKSRKHSNPVVTPPMEPPMNMPGDKQDEKHEEGAPAEPMSPKVSINIQQPDSPGIPQDSILRADWGTDTKLPPFTAQNLDVVEDDLVPDRSRSPQIVITDVKMQTVGSFEEGILTRLETENIPELDQEASSQTEEVLVEESNATSYKEIDEHEQEMDKEVKEVAYGDPVPPSTPFVIDFTKLNDLFPGTKDVDVQPEPVPDIIIDDTFASSSERNAWYRVSRFGSIRKHNMGDDENYVHLGWAKSQVRDQTHKIVRRWMEEDSITGRVVLGRRTGGSGAMMFNWNSSGPEVEIGELLGMHSRETSLNMKSPVVSPTAVAFGWTSSVPSSPSAAKHAKATTSQSPKPNPAPPAKLTSTLSPSTSTQAITLDPPPARSRATPPNPPKPILVTQPIEVTPTPKNEDDDDWGEMVTSTPIEDTSFTSIQGSFGAFGAPISPLPLPTPKSSFDDVKLFPAKKLTAMKQRPESWHMGQSQQLQLQQLKDFKARTSPLSPSFSSMTTKSPLSPVSPSGPIFQGTHTRSSSLMNVVMSPNQTQAPLQSVSTTDEDVVRDILGAIPDLSYMLR